MASATRMHYMTSNGGPPGQGRPPGVPGPSRLPSYLLSTSLGATATFIVPGPLPIRIFPVTLTRRAIISGLPPLPAPQPASPPALTPCSLPAPITPPNPPKPPANPVTSHIKAKNHTTLIHLVQPGSQPWLSKKMKFRFQPHKVDRCLTISELIAELKAPGSCDAEKGLVEMIEVGDGCWQRGTIWKKADEKSKKMLREADWTGRMKDQKPVWLAYWKEGGPN